MSVLALKVRKIGTSKGVILPKEALDAMNVADGDTIYLTRSPDGFRVTGNDPEFARQMAVAQGVAKKRRNVLRALAK